MSSAHAGAARRVLLVIAGIVCVLVLAAGAAVGTYLGTRHLRGTQGTPDPVLSATPSAYAAAGRTPSAAPSTVPAATGSPVDPAALARALRPAFGAAGLGDRVLARVVDTASGRTLLDRSGATTAAPASTAKLAVAVATLAVHRGTDRIRTTVVGDGRGTIALVGAGDPTLTAAPAGTSGAYPGAARLSDLAAQLRAAKVRVTRVLVDDSAFTGPAVSPDWAAEDVPSSYGAGITAVMADGGRAAPTDEIRSAAPDLAAGRSLARLLGRSSVPVARGSLAGARPLASVRSAPYATLVEQMLLGSDNVIAECLARRVAIERGTPVTFTGGAAAVRAVLSGLGVDPGAGLVDGSGLAPRDRVSPAALTALLRLVATTDRQAVRDVAASLPVAGWSGSLAARYVTGSSTAGAGLVRAKTGTLTGVSTLAGLVHTRGGRLVAFAVFADRNPGTEGAQAALDVLVTRLATCTC